MQINPKIETALNTLIASEAALYFKTKKAHWLVDGKAFQALHTMLDTQAAQIIETTDELAERIVMMRGMPSAGLADYQRTTTVKDLAPGKQDVATFLSTLSQDHENLSDEMRKTVAVAADDPGTADVLTRLLQDHDKAAWYLRASLG
jgi:starvation-inducible DNA-binding protein